MFCRKHERRLGVEAFVQGVGMGHPAHKDFMQVARIAVREQCAAQWPRAVETAEHAPNGSERGCLFCVLKLPDDWFREAIAAAKQSYEDAKAALEEAS